MNADSLRQALEQAATDTTIASLAPHGQDWSGAISAILLLVVGGVVVIALAALFGSWAWRGFP